MVEKDVVSLHVKPGDYSEFEPYRSIPKEGMSLYQWDFGMAMMGILANPDITTKYQYAHKDMSTSLMKSCSRAAHDAIGYQKKENENV